MHNHLCDFCLTRQHRTEDRTITRIPHLFTGLALAAFALAWPAIAAAKSKAEIDAGAAATLQRFYALDAGNRELVERAAGVLVLPDLTKAGVGLGAEFGEAVLWVDGSIRQYYTVTGAALGALIGVGQRAEVVLFMTSAARDEFIRNQRWTIDADAGAAVASRGVGTQYPSLALGKPVLSYVVNQQGLIGDISLTGLRITPVSE
jgi:lipid-binding SYLF domain-containing protein